MNIYEYAVQTSSHTQLVNIDQLVQKAINESGIRDGLCWVFIPHTTAGVTINENADPHSRQPIFLIYLIFNKITL